MTLFYVDRYRLSAFLFMFGFILIIVLIIKSSVSNQDSQNSRIRNYHTFNVYPSVHVSKNEIDLIYLAHEKDKLADCEIMCLEDKACVAVNYYAPQAKDVKSAQCWLFSKLSLDSVEAGAACCTLAIKSEKYYQIEILDKHLKLHGYK